MPWRMAGRRPLCTLLAGLILDAPIGHARSTLCYLRAAAPAADPGKKKEVAEDIITETTGY